jgi:hypothetical protein
MTMSDRRLSNALLQDVIELLEQHGFTDSGQRTVAAKWLLDKLEDEYEEESEEYE